MAIISEPERSKLYTRIRHLLGAPLRSVELEDEQMDTLLEFSIDDYSQYIQDWLIESLSDSTIYMAYYTVAHILHGISLTLLILKL